MPLRWLNFHWSPPERSELANTVHSFWMPLPKFGCFINMTQSVFICTILTTSSTRVHGQNGETPKKKKKTQLCKALKHKESKHRWAAVNCLQRLSSPFFLRLRRKTKTGQGSVFNPLDHLAPK